MSRPSFELSDEEARKLLHLVAPPLERHPVNPRDHRRFVRAFIRAVHDATGKTYGPGIYRRLLKVYGPGRSPSTATLALERAAFDGELAEEPVAAGSGDGDAGGAIYLPVRLTTVLRGVLEEYLPLIARAPGPSRTRNSTG